MKNRYNEEDFEMFVSQLIETGRVEGTEAGIAKQMLDRGYDSLSDKQKFVFDRMIRQNSVSECARCANPIPWCEMLEALDNGGLCGYCQHMQEKIDRE